MNKLTDAEKILGKTEPTQPSELEKMVFDAKTKYKVGNEQGTNISIVSGTLVKNILTLDLKKQIMAGRLKVEYNGILFERIEEPKEVISKKETVEVIEETPKPKRKRVK